MRTEEELINIECFYVECIKRGYEMLCVGGWEPEHMGAYISLNGKFIDIFFELDYPIRYAKSSIAYSDMLKSDSDWNIFIEQKRADILKKKIKQSIMIKESKKQDAINFFKTMKQDLLERYGVDPDTI